MNTTNKNTTIMTSLTIATLLVVSLSFIGIQNAYAVEVPIDNHDFETPQLDDGEFTPLHDTHPTDWVFSGFDSGVWNPKASQGLDDAYSGENVGYSNRHTFCQELTTQIEANTLYSLSVWVGIRTNENDPRFTIELRDDADNVLALLDETDDSANIPAQNSFEQNILTHTVPAEDPSIGKNLKICLGAPSPQTQFDDVHLDAVYLQKEFENEVPDLLPIKFTESTMVWFGISYTGPIANLTDNVPSEWDVVEITGPSALDCDFAQNGKGNHQKSSTKITCDGVEEVDITVKLTTRESPGKGHKDKVTKEPITVYKPTSCGTVYVNDGAYVSTLDDGVFTLIHNVGPLWLTAAEDTEDPIMSDCENDGVYDDVDLCPGDWDDTNTDTDGDGVGDVCDNASVPNPRQADFDKDGVGDVADNCKLVSNPGQDDFDVDGLGDACDPDDDNDGFNDDVDQCDFEPETVNGYLDEDGCADTVP